MLRPAILAAASLIALSAAHANAAPADRQALALTLTQGGPALVDDQRRVTLDGQDDTLRLTGLADGLMTGSLQVLTPTGQVVRMTRLGSGNAFAALLAAHEGQTITIRQPGPDGEVIDTEARVLRAGREPLLEIDGKIVTGIPGQVLFPSLPDDLPLDGGVDAVITGAKAGDADVTLRYLTGGLGWQADHSITLDQDRTRLDLVTWATISNGSGQDWDGARLALLAGDVNAPNVAPSPQRLERAMMAAAPMMDKAAGGMPEREAVGGYHLYRLSDPATLPQDTTTQVALLRKPGLATEILLESTGGPAVYHGARIGREDSHPAQILMLRNPKAEGAQPLPAGTVRVYGQDGAGNAIFLGQDTIRPLPVGEEARVTLGDSFDVTVERTVTEFQRLSKEVTETARKVVLRNGGAKAATVRVIEPLPGDWSVTQESQPHEALDANRAQWTVEVPAGGETTLTFRVRTTL